MQFSAIPIYLNSLIGHGGGYSSGSNKGEKGGKSNYVGNLSVQIKFLIIQFYILFNGDCTLYFQKSRI